MPWTDSDTDSTTLSTSEDRLNTNEDQDDPDPKLWIAPRDHNGIEFKSLPGLRSNSPSRLRSFMNLFDSSGGTLTLEDFIKFSKPPNLETLLMLIESKNKALGNTVSTDYPQATTDDLDTAGDLQGGATKDPENEDIALVLVETLSTISLKPQSISIPWMLFSKFLNLWSYMNAC